MGSTRYPKYDENNYENTLKIIRESRFKYELISFAWNLIEQLQQLSCDEKTHAYPEEEISD